MFEIEKRLIFSSITIITPLQTQAVCSLCAFLLPPTPRAHLCASEVVVHFPLLSDPSSGFICFVSSLFPTSGVSSPNYPNRRDWLVTYMRICYLVVEVKALPSISAQSSSCTDTSVPGKGKRAAEGVASDGTAERRHIKGCAERRAPSSDWRSDGGVREGIGIWAEGWRAWKNFACGSWRWK